MFSVKFSWNMILLILINLYHWSMLVNAVPSSSTTSAVSSSGSSAISSGTVPILLTNAQRKIFLPDDQNAISSGYDQMMTAPNNKYDWKDYLIPNDFFGNHNHHYPTSSTSSSSQDINDNFNGNFKILIWNLN